jgi:hypothetical protein
MDKLTRRILATSLIALFSTFTFADDWEPLLSGNSFDGWKQLGGAAKYTIKNGEVTGTSVADTPNSFMTTEKDYTDFVLEFEVWIQDGLNSGVQFRSNTKPNPDLPDGRVYGYQFELDTAARAWTAGIYDEANRGWLYPVSYNEPARSLFKNEQWNTARIECVGNEVQTFLNGKQVSHLVDEKTISGFIGLQVHSIRGSEHEGYKVRWRNLRINTKSPKLSPPEGIYIRNIKPNSLSSSEKAQGWALLFNGRKANGWKSAKGIDAFSDKDWEIKDDTLMIHAGSAAGDLVSKKAYGAFEFDFEFKLTEGANSGVKYFVSDFAAPGEAAKYLGLEYQVLDDNLHPDAKQGVVGNRTTASLYDLIPRYQEVQTRKVPLHIGSWNHGRIVALPDGTVQHWLNGFNVVEYERGSNIYDALVARSKYEKYKNFGLGEKGLLLLQNHHDEVSYRSLKIREL